MTTHARSGHVTAAPTVLGVALTLSCGLSVSCSRPNPTPPHPSVRRTAASARPAESEPKRRRPVPDQERRKIEALLGPQKLTSPLGTGPSQAQPRREPREVTVVGVARDAKLGAVVIVADQEPWYLQGLGQWPEGFIGSRVEVRGVVFRAKLGPTPTTTAEGAQRTGQRGSSRVLANPRYRRLP